jgi:hypothetical protein
MHIFCPECHNTFSFCGRRFPFLDIFQKKEFETNLNEQKSVNILAFCFPVNSCFHFMSFLLMGRSNIRFFTSHSCGCRIVLIHGFRLVCSAV